jgi:uncharacterized protein YggE
MVLAALLSLALAQQPPAQVPAATPDAPVVVAAGEGLVRRAPDRAWVMIAAESRGKTPEEAQKQNAAAMGAVLDRLKAMSLGADAIQTRGFSLQPEYDFPDNRRRLTGYVARNSVEVRVDALGQLGGVIGASVGAGATSVGGVRFDLKDRSRAEREALQQAVGDAKERAAAAAAGAGMKIDRVLRIVEGQAIEMPPPPRPMMAMREGMQAADTPIEPGEIEIRATVTLTASIK